MGRESDHSREDGMGLNVLAWILLAAGSGALVSPKAAFQIVLETRSVTLASGSVVQVEAGELRVPESRRRPTQRQVTIPFYRLRSLSREPASPIFLLAGG